MAHREGIRAYLKKVDLTGKSVVDWGCGTKPIKNYLFGARQYLGIDILPHVGADIVADISNPLYAGEFDVAFCLEVLEHVNYPNILIHNIFTNLKLGGIFYFSVPFLYPIHSDHDLWRFTDQGLNYLLQQAGFKNIEIIATTAQKEGWVGKAQK